MKLREPVQRYEVGKHGKDYIDYSGPALICPECQGTNVRKIGDEETGRNWDYRCEDCDLRLPLLTSVRKSRNVRLRKHMTRSLLNMRRERNEP